MKTLNTNNLANFRMIDEINNGFIELQSQHKLQHKLEKLGGQVNLEQINGLNHRLSGNLVVKCQQTGSFFKAIQK